MVKYAILFTLAGLLIALLGTIYGGWFLLLYWPAASSVVLGFAYLRNDPSIFGKQLDGSISRLKTLLLLPYLLYLWSIWHIIRVLSRENPFDQLSNNLTIGRRLLAAELPEGVNVVVDLTCEFAAPFEVLAAYEYLTFPILDGVAPSAPSLADFAKRLALSDRHLYIHCAQGHGRTGLVAAAVLCAKGMANTPAEAVATIQTKRPGVRLGKQQLACLMEAIALIDSK
jgi:hypothetical protein